MPLEDPFVYHVEWYDPSSGLHRQFNMSFYTSDKSVELYDLKTKKLFLRRCQAGPITKKDLFIGNTIVVYSRCENYKILLIEHSVEKARNSLSSKNFVKSTPFSNNVAFTEFL